MKFELAPPTATETRLVKELEAATDPLEIRILGRKLDIERALNPQTFTAKVTPAWTGPAWAYPENGLAYARPRQ